ncbi:hypothetical protein Tco_0779004 [Tanacetum coccineum]
MSLRGVISFNLPEEIGKFVKAHLKNVLPKYVPYYGKIKLEKAKKSMPKNSSTSVDQEPLDKLRKKTDAMLKLLDNLLLERLILKSLECYVGGRLIETDYRLQMRTV